MSTILIACERDAERQLLEPALAARGYRVLKPRDGIEALEIARTERPNLVLSHVSLPKMDGFALFRKCKQDEHLQVVPFIFYSPRHNDPKYERFAMELGAKRYIPGALKMELVLDAVDEVLAAVKQQPPAASEAERKTVNGSAAEDSEHIRLQFSERLLELESLQEKLAHTARFSRLFENNPAAMWLVDRNTRQILAVNEAALALFGYTRHEFMALTAGGLLSGGDVATFGATSVITYRHKDRRVLSLLTASKEIDFDERAAELSVAHDLSYRIRAERKVVEEAQRLRAVFASLPDAFCMVEVDGRIVDANDRYCELSGYGRDELLRLTLADLESQVSLLEPDGGRYHALHLHKNGSRWSADISASPTQAAGRRVLVIRPALQPAAAEPQRESRLPAAAALLRDGADLDEAAQIPRMLAPLAKLFDSGIVALGIADGNLQNMRLLGVHGASCGQADALSLPVTCVAQLATNAVFLSNEIAAGQLTCGGTELRRAAIGCAPLSEQQHLVLVAGNRQDEYHDWDIADVPAIAQLMAWSIARKRAGAQTLAALHRADVTVQGMVEALCRVSDQHDPHTAGSSSRVAALAVAIARTMGLGGEQQHAVYLAARLHDIGNIDVPREILGRPCILREHELALVRAHAEQGARLLSGIDLGGNVAEVVRQHHERLNGSGYPRGLKQAEIMLEARIVAVADVAEAMCSPRPHRQALGLEAALTEIAQGSGVLYDAQAASACTRLFREHGFQWPR